MKRGYLYKKVNQYIKLRNKKDFKLLLNKIAWILKQSKPVIPFLLTIIVINIVFSLIGVYSALVSKSLIDAAISGQTGTVIKWLIVMIVIALSRMVISPVTTLMNTKTSNNFIHKMQLRIYDYLIHCQWLPLSKYHSVSLLTRINADVNTISNTLFTTIPGLISLIVTFVASFSTLIYFAPSIAIAAIIITPVILIISRIFGDKLKTIYKAVQEQTVLYRTFIQESLQNLLIVKTFCMEENNKLKMKEIQKTKYDLSIKNSKLGISSNIAMNLSSTIVYFVIFCWGVLNIASGSITYGTFTAMLQLYSNIKVPLSSIAGIFPSFIGCIAATERLMELEAIPIEDQYNIDNLNDYSNSLISFKNVTFGYNDDSIVLKNLSFSIKPGEIIGLIGTSGEGKTTLIRLLLCLIKCSEGTINIGDEPLDIKHRNLISYVPQGNTLFSGTIKDNLMYGKPDATDDELISALKQSCALDFVNTLEHGINTALGEKGTGLSEGQIQRLSIARAFLRKRPILILDEVTSSLDINTEFKVLSSIKELSYKPTCIIITHRPSSLNICHKVYRLNNGHLYLLDDKITSEIASN